LVVRSSLAKDLQTLAEIIAANSTAALTFADQSAAEELLSGLRAKQHLNAARIYSAEGKLFASYWRRGSPKDSTVQKPEPQQTRFERDRLVLFHPIRLEGRLIGTLYLESDLKEIRERLLRFAGIVSLVLLVVSLVALGLISKLQAV